MSRPNTIRYDKKTARKFKTIMLVSLGAVLLGLVFGLLFSMQTSTFKNSWAFFMGLTLYLEFIGVPVLLISGYVYFESWVYLRRLAHNGFELPEDKRQYNSWLHNLPRRGPTMVNEFARDSKIAAALYSLAFIGFVIGDICYYLKWRSFESDSIAVFIFLLIVHSVFIIGIIIFAVQINKSRYIDRVDVIEPSDTRKTRIDIFTALFALVILCLGAAFALTTADSITLYIYKSRNEHYNKTFEQYAAEATMVVSSDDLVDGVWSPELVSRSPELTFSEVDGASYYVIYMVDEYANCRLHWYVDDLHDVSLPADSGVGEYRGLIRRPGVEEDHVYSISVYAMAGEPDWSGDVSLDDSSYAPYYFYYDILNVAERNSNSPNVYGNVLAYGYISGVLE